MNIYRFIHSINQSIKFIYLTLSHYNIYRDIDILIHPTNYYEGCSRVILEAGALQIPIIASKNRGIIDIIPNNNYGYILNNKSNPLEIIEYIYIDSGFEI